MLDDRTTFLVYEEMLRVYTTIEVHNNIFKYTYDKYSV